MRVGCHGHGLAWPCDQRHAHPKAVGMAPDESGRSTSAIPGKVTSLVSKVAEVKQRVLELAREMENLASAGLPSEEFFDQFLDRLVTSVGARAGAVWMKQNGRLELFCEKKLGE